MRELLAFFQWNRALARLSRIEKTEPAPQKTRQSRTLAGLAPDPSPLTADQAAEAETAKLPVNPTTARILTLTSALKPCTPLKKTTQLWPQAA